MSKPFKTITYSALRQVTFIPKLHPSAPSLSARSPKLCSSRSKRRSSTRRSGKKGQHMARHKGMAM